MQHAHIKAILEGVVPEVKSAIAAATKPLFERFAQLEAREPLKGEQGAPGKDGASVTIDDVAPLIAEHVEKAAAALPVARDGVDGKSVTVDDVRPVLQEMVKETVAALPKPVDGKDADPAVIKLMVAEEVAKIPPASDGKSVTVDDVRPVLQEMVKETVAALPKAADGKDGAPGEMSLAPDDVAAQVAKAIALVAESPALAAKSSPIVLSVNAPQKTTTKTITTERGADGNLVAHVVETVKDGDQ